MQASTHPQSSSPKITMLPVSISIANGHLLYCIRQANPANRYTLSPNLERHPIQYFLNKSDGVNTGAGDSGELLLWPSGDQTYFEQREPPLPGRREAVRYILLEWFRKQALHQSSAKGVPKAWSELVRNLLNYLVEADPAGVLTFEQEIPIIVLTQAISGIRETLAQALGETISTGEAPAGDSPPDQNVKSIIEQAIYDWIVGPHLSPDPAPESGLSKTFRAWWQRFSDWLISDEKGDTPVVKLVTADQQMAYGFDRVRQLIELCVQRTYQERLDFQEQVVALFLNGVKKMSSSELPTLAIEVSQPELPIWETIEEDAETRQIIKLRYEGLTNGEIGVRLGKAEHTISNRVTKLRKKYDWDIIPRRRPRQ